MVEAESATETALTREHAIVACGELVASIESAVPEITASVRVALALEDARYVTFLAERRIAAPLVAALRSLSERLRGEGAAIVAAGRSGERKKVQYASPSFVERMGHPGVELQAHLSQGATLEDADRLPAREGEALAIVSGAKLPTAALLAVLETTLVSGGTTSLAFADPAFASVFESALKPLVTRGVLSFATIENDAELRSGVGPLPVAITPFLYDRLELDRLVDFVVGEHLASSVSDSVRVATSSRWLQREVFQERLTRRLEALAVATGPTLVETDVDSLGMLDALFEGDAEVVGAVVHPMELSSIRAQWTSRVDASNAFLVGLNVPPSVAVDLGALAVHRGLRGHQIVGSVERVTIEGPLRRTYWSTRSEGAALRFANDGSLGAALRLCAGTFLP